MILGKIQIAIIDNLEARINKLAAACFDILINK